MVSYPVTASIGGLRVPFADAASFLSRYDDIFNPLLRAAIAAVSLRPGNRGQEMSAAPEKFVIGTGELAGVRLERVPAGAAVRGPAHE